MADESIIPLFPLGVVLLPEMPMQLHIFEPRYKIMIGECLEDNKPFGIVYYSGQNIRSVGCTARIVEVLKRYDDGRLDIMTKGEKRFFIKELYEDKPYTESRVVFFDDLIEGIPDALNDLRQKAIELLKKMGTGHETDEELEFIDALDTRIISFLLANGPAFSPEEKQVFLEITSTEARLRKGVSALSKIYERYKLTEEIRKIIGGNGSVTKSLRLRARENEPHTEG
jgi:Lon protease-like protein